MNRVEELKKEIRNSQEWNLKNLKELAKLLGLEKEWSETTGDDFETLAFKMIE
jgi:hypothetical protein